MLALLLLLLVAAAGVHYFRSAERGRAQAGRLLLRWVLVGYCGVPMVVVALLLLVHPHETAEAFGFEPDHPFALFFGWAYLGMALSALGALRGSGGWLTAPAVTWGVFFTGATFVHIADEGGVGALGHGGLLAILAAHAWVAVLLGAGVGLARSDAAG